MTWIIASLHIAFGFAIIGAIVGELLGAQHGLGLLIITSQNSFKANGVFAGMFIIAAIALVAEGLIAALEKRILGWRPPAQSESAAA
jgi:NitT/TauT family transport system permease protein